MGGTGRRMRRSPKPAKSKEAKPPVARKSPKDDSARVRDLEQRLEEALRGKADALKLQAEAQEQQAATAEILRVISSSPTDLQPVFDAIVANAVRICDGRFGAVMRLEDGLLRLGAYQGFSSDALDMLRRRYPLRPEDSGFTGLAASRGEVVRSDDVAHDPRTAQRDLARVAGYNAFLAVPMVREGQVVGVINVSRAEPFTDPQMALIQTFADQAVIAIENVRLFKELQARNTDLTEALDQQTATAEVLKVISRSAFDLQAVLTTLLENATRLCGAEWGVIFRPDGEVHRMAVVYGASPEFREFLTRTAIPPGRGSGVGRAALERRTVQVVDVSADPEYESAEFQKIGGYRTVLAVPMLREGVLLGVFSLNRDEVQPFTEKQIQLVTTFANQAVIEIEKVRLFNESKVALEQQTEKSEILRVISRSPTQIQPVFDAIARNACRLSEADLGAVILVENGQLTRGGGFVGFSDELQSLYPRPVDASSLNGRAVVERRIIHVPDLADPSAPPSLRAAQKQFRSQVSVPMFRAGEPVGVVVVARYAPGPFSDSQI